MLLEISYCFDGIACAQVLQQLEEEELMEECLEAMLEEERQHQRNMNSTAWSTASGTSDNNAAELCEQFNSLTMQDALAKQVPKYLLNVFPESIFYQMLLSVS